MGLRCAVEVDLDLGFDLDFGWCIPDGANIPPFDECLGDLLEVGTETFVVDGGCAGGSFCFAPNDQGLGTCRPLCTLNGSMGCPDSKNLGEFNPTMPAPALCLPMDPNSDVGFCYDWCDPKIQPSDCSEGNEKCTNIVGEFGPDKMWAMVCTEVVPPEGGLNASCEQGVECQEGLLCVGNQCVRSCDTAVANMNMCDMNQSCMDLLPAPDFPNPPGPDYLGPQGYCG